MKREAREFQDFLERFQASSSPLFVSLAGNGIYFRVFDNDVLDAALVHTDVSYFANVQLQAMAEKEVDWTDEDWFAHDATLSAEEAGDSIWAADMVRWKETVLQSNFACVKHQTTEEN